MKERPRTEEDRKWSRFYAEYRERYKHKKLEEQHRKALERSLRWYYRQKEERNGTRF